MRRIRRFNDANPQCVEDTKVESITQYQFAVKRNASETRIRQIMDNSVPESFLLQVSYTEPSKYGNFGTSLSNNKYCNFSINTTCGLVCSPARLIYRCRLQSIAVISIYHNAQQLFWCLCSERCKISNLNPPLR